MTDQLDPDRTFDIEGLTKVVDAAAEAATIVALALHAIKDTEPEVYLAFNKITHRLIDCGQLAEVCIISEGGEVPAKQAAQDRLNADPKAQAIEAVIAEVDSVEDGADG